MAIWLSDMDSNHDKSLQRALCYHYTIGQTMGDINEPSRYRVHLRQGVFHAGMEKASKMSFFAAVVTATFLPP